MVEQRPFKPLVGGSSPPAPTTLFPEENASFSTLKKIRQSAWFKGKPQCTSSMGNLLSNSPYRGEQLREEEIPLVVKFELAYNLISRSF